MPSIDSEPWHELLGEVSLGEPFLVYGAPCVRCSPHALASAARPRHRSRPRPATMPAPSRRRGRRRVHAGGERGAAVHAEPLARAEQRAQKASEESSAGGGDGRGGGPPTGGRPRPPALRRQRGRPVDGALP